MRHSSSAPEGSRKWGGVARRGAAYLAGGSEGRDSEAERDRLHRGRPDREQEVVERINDEKQTQQKPKRNRRRAVAGLSEVAIKEIEDRVEPKRAERLLRYLRDAVDAYEHERYPDVRRKLKPLLAEVPDVPSVLELNGMLAYRTGKWAAAIRDLEAAHRATQSFELYPVLMDSNRALHRVAVVEELWEEIRAVSPSAEVMAEARIVVAATIAEEGRLADAIRLLEKSSYRGKGQPQEHHLRSWYALADLYERSGDAGRARLLFEKVAKFDPELADVVERLNAL